MDLVFTRLQQPLSNMDFGKKEKELNGLMINKLKKSQMAIKTLDNISKSLKTSMPKYTDHLTNQSTLITNCRKYKRDLESLLIISLIEVITAMFCCNEN